MANTGNAEHTGEWTTASATDTNCALDEARRWMEACLEEQFPTENFRLAIRDGVLLCRLANAIEPGIINLKKVHLRQTSSQFLWLENLNYFIQACKQLGLRGSQLFDPSDVTINVEDSSRVNMFVGRRTEQERQLRNVAITLYWLGRAANRITTFTGPRLNLTAFRDIIPQGTQDKHPQTPTPDDAPDFPSVRRSSSAAELKLAFLGRSQSHEDRTPSRSSHSSRTSRLSKSPSVSSQADEPTTESLAICIDIGANDSNFGFVVEAGAGEVTQSRVSRVEKGSPADRAGLKVGDLVFWVNGESVAYSAHTAVRKNLDVCENERSVTLGIQRQLPNEPAAEKLLAVERLASPMEEPEEELGAQTQPKDKQDQLGMPDERGKEREEEAAAAATATLAAVEAAEEEVVEEEPEKEEPVVEEKVVEEEAVVEVIVQEETGPENMAKALEDFLATEGRQPSVEVVEEKNVANEEDIVFEPTPILKGFSTHLATVGAVTIAVATTENREKVDEVCTVQRIADAEASEGFMASPHSRLAPTVFVSKPEKPTSNVPSEDDELGHSTDDITRIGLETAATAKVVDVLPQNREVKRQRWDSSSGAKKDSTSSPPPSPSTIADDNESDNMMVFALNELQKHHGQDLDLDDEEFAFLRSMLESKEFQGAMQAKEQMGTLQKQVDEAAARETSASPALDEIQWSAGVKEDEGSDLIKLQRLINSPFLRSLCWAHDQIIKMKAREKADAAAVEEEEMAAVNPMAVEESTVMENPIVAVTEATVEATPLVNGVNGTPRRPPQVVVVEKQRGKPLGATIRTDDDGHVYLARLLQGSAVASSGKLRSGDELLSINGTSVTGKSIDEVADLMASIPPGKLELEVIPADQIEPTSTEMHVRAHFDYDPLEDELLPCPELGLSFKRGDVLHILNQQDSDWWQAVKETDQAEVAGLIPSKYLQERRESFRRIVGEEDEKAKTKKKKKLGFPKRKKKKAAVYEASQHGPYDLDEVLTYDEVMLVEPHPEKRRPIVIVGPLEGGREDLKMRIVERDPTRFATAVPHTTRLRRPDEEDGVIYHFTDRKGFSQLLQGNEFFEHGTHKDNLYGTTMKAVRNVVESGRTCIITIHPDSLRLLKTSNLQPFIIFLKPPALDAAIASKSEENITEDEAQKLKAHRVAERMEALYGHLFEKTIVNESLDNSLEEFLKMAHYLETHPQWVYMTRLN